MSSYRGAWDGGPPGAEGEYAPPPPAPPCLPATDPWTGVSYSQYGAPPYDYSAYGAAASYSYGYDPAFYQQAPDGTYYGKYPESGVAVAAPSAYPPPVPSVDYSAPRLRSRSRSHSPVESRDRERRRSYDSKSRSASPYARRERSYSRKRDDSYDDVRRRGSRSNSHRKKYSSSDRSRSRSRSYSRTTSKKGKKNLRCASSNSSASDKSYKKKSHKTRHSDHSLTPPPKVKSFRPRKHSESPGTPDSSGKRSVSRSKNVKPHSSKDRKSKDKRRDVTTPPRKKKETTPPRGKKSDRSSLSPPRSYKKIDRDNSLTPPKTYKYKERNSDTPPRKARDSSFTPPKSYARNSSSSSKSGSESPEVRPRRRKGRGARRSPSRSSSRSRSSDSSRRSRSKSKRKPKRKSPSKHRSRSKSHLKRRSKSGSKSPRGVKSKNNKRSVSPDESKSRSRSRSRSKKSQSGTPSDDERRGQFTVTDRKRFWKEHRTRQEERGREARTPPKEVKPPPGAVESTRVDDIEYGDPPDVEGPNFAEMLPPPNIAALAAAAAASTSRSKPIPIPIKNDGSFLEMFKRMQEATKKVEEEKKPEIKKPMLPFIGKRRGGRVLKTGLVKKAKAIDEQTVDNAPKDAWSLYMQEVKKYRETSCEEERKTRPLVK